MESRVEISLLERYQNLIEISQRLASTLDLDTLLNQIVEAGANLCDAEAASILLYEEAQRHLRFQAASNLSEPLMRGLTVPVDSSISGWIVMNRQPLIIPDVSKDSRHFVNVSQVTRVTTKSLMGVPMITKDRVIGVLEVINKKTGEFLPEDQNLLNALGSQAATAIENARLFQQFDLISELIHELRTPLSAINTAAHLLSRPEASADQRDQMVRIIRDETFRLNEMASSFLDLAHLESGRVKFRSTIFSLKQLIEDSINVMNSRALEKNIQIKQLVPENLPVIRGDRDKIKQVLINLISNAIKYNWPDGKVTVSAGASQEPEEIYFSVTDTGPGIAAEYFQHLFEKFYRVPGTECMAQGTGLGLSICKHIVGAHRGRIDIQSEVGCGSTFTVHLPLKYIERSS